MSTDDRTIYFGLGAVYLQILSPSRAHVRLWPRSTSGYYDIENAFLIDRTENASAKLEDHRVPATHDDRPSNLGQDFLGDVHIGSLYLAEYVWDNLRSAQKVRRPHELDGRQPYQYQSAVYWDRAPQKARYFGFYAKVLVAAKDPLSKSEVLVQYSKGGSWVHTTVNIALGDTDFADKHTSEGGLTHLEHRDGSDGALYLEYKYAYDNLGIPKLPPGLGG